MKNFYIEATYSSGQLFVRDSFIILALDAENAESKLRWTLRDYEVETGTVEECPDVASVMATAKRARLIA